MTYIQALQQAQSQADPGCQNCGGTGIVRSSGDPYPCRECAKEVKDFGKGVKP